MIFPISNGYDTKLNTPGIPDSATGAPQMTVGGAGTADSAGKVGTVDKPGKKPSLPGIKDPNYECQTCKNRKYQDGSDEMVSFKSPAHISPEASGAAVRSHEQEHVTNAYSKAANGNGKVLSATVSLKTAICPECGRSYVAGGVTRTRIQYANEKNPYEQDRKSKDSAKLPGMNYAQKM